MPYYLGLCWKKADGGRVRLCTKPFKDIEESKDEDLNGERKERAMDNLVDNYINFKSSNVKYALMFVLYEFVCFISIFVLAYILDFIMDKFWFEYGIKVIKYYLFQESNNDWDNPMDIYFPKITKCDYFEHSSNGQIDKYDLLCLLPLNQLNEKIFLVII